MEPELEEIMEVVRQGMSVAKVTLKEIANDREYWQYIALAYRTLFNELCYQGFSQTEAIEIITKMQLPLTGTK